MRVVIAGIALVLAITGLVARAPVTGAAAPAAGSPPLRVLLLGDSVTQGSAGDHTWRYRLWRQLTAAGTDLDLVGPRDDLRDNLRDTGGSHAYVDPDFDSDHAGLWGRTIGEGAQVVRRMARRERPAVVVVQLGVNDLLLGGTPQRAAEALALVVGEIRAARPGADVVLAEVAQTWFDGAGDLNDRIAGLAAAMTTERSRVVVAHTAAGYDRTASTWDGSHPNAAGEVLMAAAVQDALAALGVAPAATRPLPEVALGPRVAPSRVRAVPGTNRVTLHWAGPPGATGEYVWVRELPGGSWSRLPWLATGHRTEVGRLVGGHRYAFRLQPVKGDEVARADAWSRVVRVRPRPPVPGAVTGLRLFPRKHGLHAGWAPAAWAAGYAVAWWPVADPTAVRARAVPDAHIEIQHLRPGRRYVVTVRARNASGVGEPVSATVRTRRAVHVHGGGHDER